MSVMVQIRNMPDEMHRELKLRAVSAGMSLSEYLLRELRDVTARPTMEQFIARLRSLPPVELPESPSVADIIREERDRR